LRSHPEPAISEKNNERTKHTNPKTNIIHLALALFAFAYFAPGPKAFAVGPPPDGGHSNGNMAEGVSNSVEISEPSPLAAASLLTLDNGVIKVGVDTTFGGAITYLSQSGSTTNLINDSNTGALVRRQEYPTLYTDAGLKEAQRLGLEKLRTIYIGSPVYTAIG
jgi:hypothetical protein